MAIDSKRIEAVLAPATGKERERQEERVRAGFFKAARRAMRYIPFMEDVVASYYCAIDPKTPTKTRGILIAALAYFVLPFDLVPDVILGLGFTDDIAVLLTAFRAVQDSIRPEHYRRAKAALGDLAETEDD